MTQSEGPDVAPDDHVEQEAEGMQPADDAEQPAVPDSGSSAGDGRQPSARRASWSPWWRLAAATVAVGVLTWGVTASDAALWLDGERTGGSAGAPTTAASGAFVEAAVLACPGPVPWLKEASDARPHVEVLAAGAPQSVLDAVPPQGADGGAVTAAPPDQAAATGGPDAAATTAAPDAASSTGAPDASQVSGESPAQAPPEGASVLRTTDEDGPQVELRHGIPDGFVLERPASAVVEAGDGLAPGVAGGQLGVGTEAGARGLTVSACVTAGEMQWLVGGGSAPGRAEQLVLSNPGPDAVTVEVSVWGADGPVETTGASGIVVPGGGRVVELLDALAPSADAPLVAVSATGGPVVAHLAESYREGTTDRGTEVVPPVTAPSTDLVLPALPAAPGGHERQVVLRIGAPGETEAVVDLTALTADGAVRLTDQVTRVPAGSTVDVELRDLPAGATALRLRSDEPVTAGARLEVLPAEGDPEVVGQPPGADDAAVTAGADQEQTTAGPGDESGATDQGEPLLRAAGDVAWVGATVPTATPTGMALPSRGAVPGAAAVLALTAVDGTTAWVTWVDEAGQESSRSVPLPNDTTALVPLPQEARAVWVVGAGPAGVSAAVHVTGGDGRGPYVASTTLPELPWLRQVTQVQPVVP